MSFSSYGAYLARRNGMINCCCQIGPTGPTGSEGGATGATGPTGSLPFDPSGNLDMSCNLIIDVSGIYFCDGSTGISGSYIGPGSSFDISTNHVFKIRVRDEPNSFVVDQSGNILLRTDTTLPSSSVSSYLYFKGAGVSGMAGPYIALGGEDPSGNPAYQTAINMITKGNFTAPSLTSAQKGWHIVAKGDSYATGAQQNMLKLDFKNETSNYISGFNIAAPGGSLGYTGAEIGMGNVPVPGVSLFIDPSNNIGGAGSKMLGAIRIAPMGDIDTGELQFMEKSGGGTNYVGFKAPDSIPTNVVWKLPDSDGLVNQVLTTDGATNLSWESGASGTSENAVIPYEPWNQDILLSDTIFTLSRVYWISFIAPTTGNYTNATILPSGTNAPSNNSFSGNIGVGIYDNAVITAASITNSAGRLTQNLPRNRLGQDNRNFPFPGTNICNAYLEFSFDTPIPLVKDTLYWFAMANDQNQLRFNNHIDYQQTNCQIVEERVVSYSGGIPTMPASSGGAGSLQVSDKAVWFRIYNENASFITGLQGPTGATGPPVGLTGVTGQLTWWDSATTIAPTPDAITSLGANQILFNDSTSAAPYLARIAWQNHPNTGFFRYAGPLHKTVAITTGGVMAGLYWDGGGGGGMSAGVIPGFTIGFGQGATGILGLRRCSSSSPGTSSWDDGHLGNSDYIVFTPSDFNACLVLGRPSIYTVCQSAAIARVSVGGTDVRANLSAAKLIPKGFRIKATDIDAKLFSDAATGIAVITTWEIHCTDPSSGPGISMGSTTVGMTIAPAALNPWAGGITTLATLTNVLPSDGYQVVYINITCTGPIVSGPGLGQLLGAQIPIERI